MYLFLWWNLNFQQSHIIISSSSINVENVLLNIFAETDIFFRILWWIKFERTAFEIVIFNFDQLKASLLSNFIHICIHTKKKNIYIYTHIHIHTHTHTQWKKIIFDPLLILYVCPLTKKLSVYNFNGRFIWTVRDRTTTTKKCRKSHSKKVLNWLAF